ncbi:hypothetical protein GCM10027067_18050 [Pseudactinotalea suaedae]
MTENIARSPVRRIAGSGNGVVIGGVSQPAFPQDDPAATLSVSTTVTSSPARRRCHAVESPTMPAPTTTAEVGVGRGRRMSPSCMLDSGLVDDPPQG